jgi:hypothetical protein
MTPAKKDQKRLLRDQEAALNFLKLYHPNLWDTVSEDSIKYILIVAYALFKSRPELLEATTQERFDPIQ